MIKISQDIGPAKYLDFPNQLKQVLEHTYEPYKSSRAPENMQTCSLLSFGVHDNLVAYPFFRAHLIIIKRFTKII